ncbi:MAG TPA: hypothetical protein PLG90_05235 [Ignavibacteria bacterium]|nr:hypothetical protein [Ignavibacteria bacterium]
MAKPKVILRADGNSSVGLGHIMRLKTFSGYINDIAEITFVTKCDNELILNELKSSGIEVLQIDYNIPFQNEILYLLNLKPDCVVFDGYDFKTEYQTELRKNNIKIVSLDDDFNCHYESDIVINHAPNINPDMYSKETYTKLLLGIDYLIINPVFFKCTGKNKNENSISVNFGGADPGNLTLKYLKCIYELNIFNEINIITGAANTHIKSIENFIESNDSGNVINFYNSISQDELSDIFCRSEYSLCPSSSVTYESLASKCIVFSGISADNQINIYKGLSDLNLIVKCGDFNSLKENDFSAIVRNTILNSEFKNQLIDNIFSIFTNNQADNYKLIFRELFGSQ